MWRCVVCETHSDVSEKTAEPILHVEVGEGLGEDFTKTLLHSTKPWGLIPHSITSLIGYVIYIYIQCSCVRNIINTLPLPKSKFYKNRSQEQKCSCFIFVLGLITRKILGEEYISFRSSLHNFLHSPVTSSLSEPNILLSTLSSAYVSPTMWATKFHTHKKQQAKL